MSTPKRLFCSTFAILLLGSVGGCIIVSGSGSSWGWGSTAWTEVETEQLALDTTGLEELEVRTHNGRIDFEGQPTEGGEASITVTKKGGGLTSAGANAALNAIEVFVKPAGSGTQRIGWRWKGIKRIGWHASVSFAITAPGELNLDIETHNGRVGVAGAAGDVQIVTHNGRITVASEKGRLHAVSHNGRITADYTGKDLTLLTHNGRIDADLRRCGAVRGDITTHNGSVELAVGDATSAMIDCDTHNGSVDIDVPIETIKVSRGHVEGRLGEGGDTLVVSTHNGSIVVRKPAG